MGLLDYYLFEYNLSCLRFSTFSNPFKHSEDHLSKYMHELSQNEVYKITARIDSNQRMRELLLFGETACRQAVTMSHFFCCL